LPGREGYLGVTARDHRLLFEAVGWGIAIVPAFLGVIGRHPIEHVIARLKKYPPMGTRNGKTGSNFLGAIYLAASVVWLNG